MSGNGSATNGPVPAKLVVGVWKDRLTASKSVALAEALRDGLASGDFGYVAAVAPAPIASLQVRDVLRGSRIEVVAQDVHWPATQGSYIGTTSFDMLQDAGIQYAMVGHSERRRFFCESNDAVARKIAACLESAIVPVVCIGDDTTDLGERRSILETQIANGFRHEAGDFFDMSRVIVAYEPVWAISTWRSEQPLPTGEEVADMLALVREIGEKQTGQTFGQTPILFGGSVNPTTAPEYFAQPEVDGALVGGASLTAESMASVFRAADEAWPS